MSLSVANVIFDTGSSLCYLPPREYNQFMQEVQKVKTCEYNDNEEMMYCQCSSVYDADFPILAMLVGGSTGDSHWFYLSGRDYLSYYRNRRYNCAILIKKEDQISSNMWLLGDPFLRAYYSIYDLENKKIGLVGIAETTRAKGDTSIKDKAGEAVGEIFDKLGIDSEEKLYMWAGVISVICFLYCCCCIQ